MANSSAISSSYATRSTSRSGLPAHLREKYQYFTQAEMGKIREAGYTHSFTRLEDGVRETVQHLMAQAG
jgi:hypothetical protein